MSITWQLPGMRSADALKSKPLAYAGFILGAEHEGSLLLTLIDRGLANSLSAGAGSDEKELALFEIQVSLTKHGLAKWRDVVRLVLSAAKQAREQAIDAALAARQKAESELAFKTAEKSQPDDYASNLAASLQDYAPAHVLTGPSLSLGFNASLVRTVFDHFTARSMVIKLTSSSATTSLAADKAHVVDPYYGTLFKPLGLSDAFLASCDADTLAIDPQLRLPSPTNAFLTQNLTLVAPPTPPPLDAPPPAIARNGSASTLWYRLDTSFGMPYASATLAVTLPPVSASAADSALAALYVSLTQEQLKPLLSDASAAQLSLSLAAGSTTLSLDAYGLSPKLPALLSASAASLVAPVLKPGRFAAHKQLLADSLANEASTPTPTTHAKTLFSELTLKHYFSANETATALEPLAKADLVRFGATLFERGFTEMLVTGNLEQQAAVDLAASLEQKLAASPLPPDSRAEQMRANLAGGNWVYAAKHPNPQEDNGCVRLVLQLGKLGAAGAAAAEAFDQLVSQAFFYELRTVQQLGYIVQSAVSEDRGVHYLIFIVQSTTSPDEVTSRVHTFVEGIDARLAATSAATYASVVSAAQQELLEPPKKLSSVAATMWDAIDSRTYRFGWSKTVAAALGNTTIGDVRQFWNRTGALVGGGGRLLLQVYGSGHTLPSAQAMPQGYTVLQSTDDFRKSAVYW